MIAKIPGFRLRSDIRRLLPSLGIAAAAALAIGYAPYLLDRNVPAPAGKVAPVQRDYLQRDARVAVYE